MNTKRGFTIIELLVAMTLFVVVIAATSGAFIQALRTQRATVALIAANSNAALAIEQMMRDIRTGSDFFVNDIATVGKGTKLTFLGANETVTYNWNSAEQSIEKSTETTIAQRLTAENVTVEKLEFKLFDDPSYPPRITIVLRVGAKNAPSTKPFINLQTTVSARLLK